MSGDVSDSPGRSSALVGVTVKRTDAMAAHLERDESGRSERAKSDEWRENVEDEWSRTCYLLLGGAGVRANSRICSLDAAHLH